MRRLTSGRAGMALAFLLGLLIATAGTATAARLITGKQIRDGSITSRDLSKSIQKTLKAAAKPAPGPAGPQGPQGPPGPSTGPAGGDLAGSYPNPTLRRPDVVPLNPADPGCIVIQSAATFCPGWSSAGGGSFVPMRLVVEPGGFVQFEGTVQRSGSVGTLDERVFYLPKSLYPNTPSSVDALRFPVVRIQPSGETKAAALDQKPAYIRIGANGEVWMVDPDVGDNSRYDLSSVRFRIK